MTAQRDTNARPAVAYQDIGGRVAVVTGVDPASGLVTAFRWRRGMWCPILDAARLRRLTTRHLGTPAPRDDRPFAEQWDSCQRKETLVPLPENWDRPWADERLRYGAHVAIAIPVFLEPDSDSSWVDCWFDDKDQWFDDDDPSIRGDR